MVNNVDAEDLATVVALLDQWGVLMRHTLSVGAARGLSEHVMVNDLADSLFLKLGSDEMAGALATAIFLLARRG